MKAHIDAIRASLAGLTTYHVAAPTAPTYPYVLVWSSNGLPHPEQAVQSASDFTDTIGITCVAGSPDGVLIVRDRVRTLLDGSHPLVEGRLTWLNLFDSQPTAVDRDVTIPSGGHPAYGVDLYRLVSVPA